MDSPTDLLVTRFIDRTLPAAEWTHQAHLATAVWFNMKYPKLEALYHLRCGIITYNVASGGTNTPEKGYHETLTIFWCHIISDFVRSRTLPLEEMVKAFLGSPLASRELPLQYYTKENLFSVKARTVWVAPDLKEVSWDY